MKRETLDVPLERERTSTVLILLDHAMEMLLKASLVQKAARFSTRNVPDKLSV